MKKYFSILFCFIIVLSFIGCSKTEKTNAEVNSQSSSAASSESSSEAEPSSQAAISSEQSGKSNSHLTSFTEGNITFMLPSNYQKKGESPILYVPSDYPKVTDNFNIAITPKDPNFNKLTKENYQKQLASLYSSANVSTFEPTTISNLPALKIRYTLTYNGVKMEQAQYAVNSDKTYVFTYSFVNGDLKNYVDDCAASITINK